MYVYSAMTPAEIYRTNGTLPDKTIEELITAHEKLQAVEGIECNIAETATQFPDEDFLQDIISDLQTLAKRIRGDNKSDLLAIIDNIENLQLSTHNEAEYGRSELKQALKAIEEE